MNAGVPLRSKNGSSGMLAPRDEGEEGARRGDPGTADGPRIEAHLITEHRVERPVGRREERGDHGVSLVRGEPAVPVDAFEDSALPGLVLSELPLLEQVLRLEQLVLRADRDVLADRHREGARQQARDARDDDGLVVRGGASDAHHEGQVRDEAVAAAEHRRSQERRRPTLMR
jgi:hypothetical protein